MWREATSRRECGGRSMGRPWSRGRGGAGSHTRLRGVGAPAAAVEGAPAVAAVAAVWGCAWCAREAGGGGGAGLPFEAADSGS
eukprot:1159606-Pelagomonas_calceolata.AAC.12